MVYKAKELLSYLNNLTLTGINNGNLEWIGIDKQWDKAKLNSDKELYEEDDFGDSLGQINGVDSDEYRDNEENR